MSVVIDLIFLVYSLALVVITVYCLMQLQLLFYYKRFHFRKNKAQGTAPQVFAKRQTSRGTDGGFPFVTIQLPIFNEVYVVERLIDNIMKLDYPRDRFEVHVLDDSTDETLALTRRKVAQYRALGFNIEQICRQDRKGYKAGALKDAIPFANGEFIAIFDADFLPKASFLRDTMPYFEDARTGVVQTRWEHLNENFSIITRLQALQLNVHFSVEQQGRQAGSYLRQFNGTAGIWRRATIADAGGWQADTLTEDLDLSIRAQLRGWEIVYLEGVGSPAELPAEMNGLKSQQFRWMKGGAETARKMLPTVWRSGLTLGQKAHVTLQLFGSTVFVFVFIMGVLSVPALYFFAEWKFGREVMAWAAIGLVAFIAVQYTANVQLPAREGRYWRKLLKFAVLFPLFLALSMGLSLHNTIAVLQGWLGKQSAFVRTPKFNILGLRQSLRSKKYLATQISWTTVLEGALTLYFLGALAFACKSGNWSFLLLHGLLALGYGIIFFYTLRHLRFR